MTFIKKTLEKDLESKVVKLAKDCKFLTYKFTSPSVRGVPDRIFISPSGKLFFIEFKAKGAELGDMQNKTIKLLRGHFQDVHIVDNYDYALDIFNKYIPK